MIQMNDRYKEEEKGMKGRRNGKERSRERRVLKNSLFPSCKLHQFVHGGVDLVHRNWCLQPECSTGKGTHRLFQDHLQTSNVKWGFSRIFHLGPSIKDFEAPFTKMDDDDCIMVNQLPQIVMQHLRRAQISCNILQQFTTIPMF